MKRYTIISLILISAIFIMTGCSFGGRDVSLENTASVYYIEGNGTELIEAVVSLPDASKRTQIKYLIEQLLTPPAGKTSPLSDGTELISATVKDEIAIVDFTKEFYGKDDLKNALVPAAVAKTLCSLDFVSGVSILVEGEAATGVDGKAIGIIMESDIVNANEQKDSTKTTLTLYFTDEMAEGLVAERREVEIPAAGSVEKIVVEELIKGPKSESHIATIPQETKVLSVETKNNVCFVNLSKEFVTKHQGGSSGELFTVYSVVNSLTELGTVSSVQFLIEGEKRDEYLHLVFNEPIMRDTSMIIT